MDGQKPKLKFRSSWDDGDQLDDKIARLLLHHKLPAIFYLPTSADLDDREIKLLHDSGFEIGGHTETHPMDMKLLSDEQLEIEIVRNKKYLETIIGAPITNFCYPRGRYDQRVIDAVKAAGYTEARTTVILKIESEDPFKTDTSIHVAPRKEYAGMDWFDVSKRMADWAFRTDGVFHIWGHSWEIEEQQNWVKLDLLFKWLKENYEIVKA